MNIFKEMGYSAVKPGAYAGFLKNNRGKIFGYGMLLMLFYFLLSVVFSFIGFQIKTGGFGQIVNETLPDFELSDQGFWIEEPFVYDEGASYVAANSMDYFDLESASRFVQRYRNALIIDREKMLIKSNGQVQTLYFNMLESGTYISKQNVMAIIPMLYLIILLVLIFYFIIITALFFFGVLMVSLLGLILNAVAKAELTFGEIFILGIYARTWPLLFKGLVVRLLGVRIPFFWVINFGVTLVYMFLAMRKIAEERALNMQYAQAQASDPYGQGGYGRNFYQQGSYQQGMYRQNPYSREHQEQIDNHSQENGRNDFSNH